MDLRIEEKDDAGNVTATYVGSVSTDDDEGRGQGGGRLDVVVSYFWVFCVWGGVHVFGGGRGFLMVVVLVCVGGCVSGWVVRRVTMSATFHERLFDLSTSGIAGVSGEAQRSFRQPRLVQSLYFAIFGGDVP